MTLKPHPKQTPVDKAKEWIDYTTLKTMMECPRMGYWRFRKGLVTDYEPVAIINGQAYHEAIAKYHTLKQAGHDFEYCVKYALLEAGKIMRSITVEDSKRNLSVAVATLIKYFNTWRYEAYETVAVEIGGAVDLGPFIFVFKADGLVKTDLGYMIRETKTTTIIGTKWHKRGKPNLQLEGYMFGVSALTGYEVIGGILDIIPIHEKPTSKHDPFRIMTYRSEEELNAWYENISRWMELIKHFDQTEFPMNTERCYPLMAAECPYTILCEKYPKQQETYEIPGEYKERFWFPLGELTTEGD